MIWKPEKVVLLALMSTRATRRILLISPAPKTPPSAASADGGYELESLCFIFLYYFRFLGMVICFLVIRESNLVLMKITVCIFYFILFVLSS